MPKVSRVAILRNPNISSHIAYGKETEKAAKTLGVRIQFAEMQTPNDKGFEDTLGSPSSMSARTLC